MFTTADSMARNYPRSRIPPPNFDQGGSTSGEDDTTLAGLKEIVSRQQREIENHQQQLVAKEQRLKFLKQPDAVQMNEDSVRAMRDKINSQEQKLERLRELKGKVDQQRSLNVSELDSVRALFKEKEHEMVEAVAKVDSLTKQLDTIRKSRIIKGDSINITVEELEKLKADLKITQDANEAKSRELAIQLDLLNQRNKQVDYLDKRIEELQARLRKKKQAEQNQVKLAPPKVPTTNVATVEPSIRMEPIPATSTVIKVPLVPNPNDPRYQTLPNNFKYNQGFYPQPSIYNQKPERTEGNFDPKVSQYDQKPRRNSPTEMKAPPPRQEHVNQRPMPPTRQHVGYHHANNAPDPRPMYTSAAHPQNRAPVPAYMGDSNNNNRRVSPDYTKKDQTDSVNAYRPNSNMTPVNQPYKPMYASRSVIADTYMKRLGPKPQYKAMIPHSIPAFHLQNSIISDRVSFKNNTLRSLRRRHSYTETDEAKIEAALGPREATPGGSATPIPASTTPLPTQEPARESPKPEPENRPINTSNSSHNSSICSDEPSKVPNSGIVARQILKKEIGVKRNLDRRVTFDPLALLLDASLEGEFELVQRSAAQVPDASQPNDEGITALHNAICAGHFDIVKFLVKFGVDINSQDIDGWTPLHCASSCNNLPMVKFLVENGACIYALTFSDHETPAEKSEDEDDDGCTQYLYGIQEKLGVLNNGSVYALYDYQATKPDELSFRNGEKLTVLRMDKEEREWWWACNAEKREGFIPRTFLGLFPRVQTM